MVDQENTATQDGRAADSVDDAGLAPDGQANDVRVEKSCQYEKHLDPSDPNETCESCAPGEIHTVRGGGQTGKSEPSGSGPRPLTRDSGNVILDLNSRGFFQALATVARERAKRVANASWTRMFRDLAHCADVADAFLARDELCEITVAATESEFRDLEGQPPLKVTTASPE